MLTASGVDNLTDRPYEPVFATRGRFMESNLSRLLEIATEAYNLEKKGKSGSSRSSIREVVIDVETTGFSPGHGDRIVSIALVEILDYREIGKTLVQLVNPRRKIPSETTSIHGITNADVSSAPTFPEISQNILNFIGNSCLIGYNVSFDLNFLRYELESIDVELPSTRFVDVMELVSRHSGARKKLHVACQHYQIDLAGIRAHSAKDDALVTALLYAKMRSCFSAEDWEISRFQRNTLGDSAEERSYENDELEKSWREFQNKNYSAALKLANEVVDSDSTKTAAEIDARPYELAAMILRRMKQLKAERELLLTFFRRAVRPEITFEEISRLSEPPPMVLLTETDFNDMVNVGNGHRPTPYLWEMAARLLRVIELEKPIEVRLYKALRDIPSQYAYEEVAICLRKIISEAEKKKESISVHLDTLYRFAQQHAFLYEEVFDKRLGYSVRVLVVRVPRSDLKFVQAPYVEVGYRFLPLLKQSDIRRLVRERGEPNKHERMGTKLKGKWEPIKAPLTP